MNIYEFELIKIKEQNKVLITSAYGNTIDEAINHLNYWANPNEVIGIDFAITHCTERKLNYTIDIESLRKSMEIAISDKIGSIHKILQSNADDEDKTDMIKCVVNEAPYMLMKLDTACRDMFAEIINEN